MMKISPDDKKKLQTLLQQYEAEVEARKEAEAEARREAIDEALRELEAEFLKGEEEKARRKAEEKARKEAEEKARKEAREKARIEAREKARIEAREKARREAEAEARRKKQEREILIQRILGVVIFSVVILSVLILMSYQNNHLKDQRIQDIARKYNFQILTANERKESTNGFSDTILAQEKSYSSGCVYFCSKNICWEKGYNADVFYREKYDNLKYKTENSLRTMLADELRGQLLTRTVNALMEICK